MSNPLISIDDIAAAGAGEVGPVVLDVRWSLGGPSGIDEYRRGHIPGARFIDLDRDLAAAPGGGRGRHPLPQLDDFEAAMRRAGVNAGQPVAVYDAGGGLSAARAWWLLRYFGHRDVRLLDGGLAAWSAAGYPLSTEEAPSATGDFTASPGGMPLLDAASAAALTRTGVLLDARAAERYRGEVEPVDSVAGHIPGARSAPTTANLQPDGRFLPADQLRQRFAAAGVDTATPVGAYCGSGVTAAHEVLALALAGFDAALYPGSWSEWVSDPSRPIATGREPG
jgi:thiosulfate/3-mercaptopyruvate sulfurtransferase